jgi:Zn-dependent protease
MEFAAVMARVAIVAVPLLVAVVFHEVAHGVVAYACGDPTAARAGRLTLNPLAHIDPVGTILVPGLLLLMPLLLGTSPFVFGWAKPVPINPRWFRRPRLDGLLVALAGPGTNLVLAALSALALGWLASGATGATPMTRLLGTVAAQSVIVNCVLAVFNLLPVPPLDGGRVLAAVAPPEAAQLLNRFERIGIIVVLLLVMNTGILGSLVQPVIGWCYALARQVAG